MSTDAFINQTLNMKKITISLLLILFAVFSGYSQVQIGTGTDSTQKGPITAGSRYSYNQSIYLASEINTSGSITSLQWYYNGIMSGIPGSQELTIYLGHTAKTSFNTLTDWQPVTQMTAVYSGGINVYGAGWVTITLDTPFVYNGTDNLVVGVAETSNLMDFTSDVFYNTEVPAVRSLTYYSDYVTLDPAYPPTAGFKVNSIPNIIFGGITQSCPTPLYVSTSAITTTSATVSWEAPQAQPAGGSEYYVSTTDSLPNANTIATGSIATGNSAVITSGLSPSTVYYIWVRNNCGNGNFSAWSYRAIFKTACLPIGNFNENFDTVTTPDLPTCWSYISRGAVTGVQVMTINHFPSSLPNTVVMYAGNVYGDYEVILVSPNLSNLSQGTNHIKFYAYNQGAAGNVQIGTLDGDGNSATSVFSPYDTVEIANGGGVYSVDLSGYSGTDTYIGIRLPVNTAFSIYLDDIAWEPNPTCPDISETNVSEINPEGATIMWSGGGNEQSWEVAVGGISVTDPDTLTPVISDDTAEIISGLNPGTDYNVWIRSVCSDTEKGSWVGPLVFGTECVLPAFSENFDTTDPGNMPDCWKKIFRGETISPYSQINISTFNPPHSQPNGVEMFLEGSNVATDDIMLVTPRLSTLELGTYRLKFYAKSSWNTPVGSLQIGTLDIADPTGTFNLITEVITTEQAAQYIINFDTYTGTDHYIAIRMNNSGSYSYSYLDDIVWEPIPACPDVAAISVVGITPNTADISWQADGGEASWEVAYGGSAVTDPDTLPVLATPDTQITVPGLADATNYKVWVRSVCTGNVHGTWIGPVTLTTDCVAVTTLNEKFDTVNEPGLPSCWKKILRGTGLSTGALIQTSSYDAISFPNSVFLFNEDSTNPSDVILVSPNLSNVGAGTHRLKFRAKREGGSLQIGRLSSSFPDAVFTVIQEISTTANADQYSIDFPASSGDDRYIGIRLNASEPYSSSLVDDIIWEPIPQCPDVSGITAAATGMSTASVSWAQGNESSWEVIHAGVNVTDPESIQEPFISAASNSAALNNLSPNTTYNVWVRSTCGNGHGNWIGPVSLTTDCDATNLPYVENFNDSGYNIVPNCTTMAVGGDSSAWSVTDENIPGYEAHVLNYYGNNNAADAWFFTRGINLTAGTSYTLYYRYGNNSPYFTEKLKVKYGTTATIAAMTETLADHPVVTGGVGTNNQVQFTPVSTGVYYFGFNAYSDAYDYRLYLDDIMVTQTLSVGDFDLSALSYYPNPVKDVLNLSYVADIDAVVLYNLLGQEVFRGMINSKEAHIDMASLPSGAYLVKIKAENQERTIRVVKQ